MSEVIREDPTLTDLAWLGDGVSLHLCDGETILEVDPARLRPVDLPFIGRLSSSQQAVAGAAFSMLNLPVYMTIDVEDRVKAQRLLDQFTRRIFLNNGELAGFTTKLDSYRLPDYKEHPIHVLSGRIYAVTARLHLAQIGDQLVMATSPDVLRQVIDVSQAEPQPTPLAQLLMRFNRRALHKLADQVQLYWSEKSRLACHTNVISIYNLHKLYGVPIDKVARISESKYGVRYYCPDGGTYTLDEGGSQIVCSAHGNRENSKQYVQLNQGSSFAKFMDSLNEIVAGLRFQDEALIATIEISRAKEGPEPTAAQR